MLDSHGFDLWADQYDQYVAASDEENKYPFAGYKDVLNEIYRIVLEKPGASVLDVGFGTGTLTAALYRQGCEIYGQDFSARMVRLASEKMPEALLCLGDFSLGLVPPLPDRKYDFIVATYAMHHLTDEQKLALIDRLLALLADGGALLIGDISFPDRAALEACRLQAGDEWDDEEIYIVADELRAVFPDLVFLPKSHCGGVLKLTR